MDKPPDIPVEPSPDWLDASPVPAASLPPQPPAPHHQPSTPRRFLHALAVFLSLFLVVRTVALEPFGVPTGSMAPALIGNHREAPCPRCGFPVLVGEPGPDARPVRFEVCRCPNCGEPVDLAHAREVPGDRVMVDKTAYQTRGPRRWEVAVFHCPADLTKPYVKRVAGLPGELIRIVGGDVYADGVLCRKTLAQAREVCVPVFDMDYPPRPDGWNARWVVEPAGAKLPAVSNRVKERPADASVLRDDALFLDATRSPGVGLTYRQWNLDMRQEEPVGDWLAYNGGLSDRRGFARRRPGADSVHDFLVEFDLEVLAGSGTFACRLGDGADTVAADFRVGVDRDSARVGVSHDGGHLTTSTDKVVLWPGKTYHVEFAFVDRRASLAIDGTEVVAPLDLPADPAVLAHRGSVSRPVQLGARGASVAVRNLRLLRDIHYLPAGKPADGWRLGPDEYFMLGDNTSNSHDSRLWTIDDKPAPGVPEGNFIGKPFLIHQPLRLGRVTINGRDHLFQTLDWSRLRWLR